MTPEREATIRDAWRGIRDHEWNRPSIDVLQRFDTPRLGLGRHEYDVLTFEYMRGRPPHGHRWQVVCEGLVVEFGAG